MRPLSHFPAYCRHERHDDNDDGESPDGIMTRILKQKRNSSMPENPDREQRVEGRTGESEGEEQNDIHGNIPYFHT